MKDPLTPAELIFKDYTLKGVSTAGVGTCITVPTWKVCFDVAQGLPFAFSMNHFLISHLHQDHASGIPYLISQKAMMSHKPPHFFFPPGAAEPIEKILKIWEQAEDHSYSYHLEELSFGKRIPLQGSLFVESFPTQHRVRSQGYTLSVRNKHLKKEFQGLPREELIRLKERGETLEQEIFVPKISFTGDTQIEFLDLAPQVVESETLVMEVTYIDDKKGVASAREWGHIHLRELIARIPRIKSENIVLIHFSARYSRQEIQEALQTQLPEEMHRLHIL